MSAYVVDKKHVDALVAAAVSERDSLRWFAEDLPEYEGDYDQYIATVRSLTRRASLETADEIGQMLVMECVASVSSRYPDDNVDAGELPGPCEPYYLEPYRFPIMSARTLSPVETLGAIDQYEYQACEHGEWEGSEAQRFCSELRSAKIHRLPGYAWPF